ncbi:(Na+)-NQR maturation NqrM [Psychromonas aquimarina]|uniref:(Na+)-NQR maturation NqrM n=1 Tax=Psychromonas aquimarina TaxID=444919 RepID=UPI00040A2D88|nr:(Na+)-NQR maturation NqrM [Psychromonas aquimarina]
MLFVITFITFALAAGAMALGVIFHRRELQGSCAGLVNLDIEPSCDCETVCDEHRTLYQIEEPQAHL